MLNKKIFSFCLVATLLTSVFASGLCEVKADEVKAQKVDTKKQLNLKTGAYLGRVSATYLNPLTQTSEDGGTNNASIGEGMVDGMVTPTNANGGIDSVFGKAKPGEEHYADFLLERSPDGRYYATVRMYLQNYIKFDDKNGPFISTLNDDNTYKKQEYIVTKTKSEKDGVNYNDFRFEIPNGNSYVMMEAFIVPMSRPVKFFMVLDGSEAKAGQGDFIYEKPKSGVSVIGIVFLSSGVVLVLIGVAIMLKKRKQQV